MENKGIENEYLRIKKSVWNYYREMGFLDDGFFLDFSLEYMILSLLTSHKHLRYLNLSNCARVSELTKTHWGRIKLRIWNWIEGR